MYSEYWLKQVPVYILKVESRGENMSWLGQKVDVKI